MLDLVVKDLNYYKGPGKKRKKWMKSGKTLTENWNLL